MAFIALLDACVLYPAPLRDLLLRLAATDAFRVRWSEQINAEWFDALTGRRPELAGPLRRTLENMEAAFPDALVTGHEALIDRLELPDPDDRHVLAAAIVGRVDVIVTCNLRDFPAATLAPFGVEVQHPDTFIRHALDLHQAVMLDAVRRHRASHRRPPFDPAEYLDVLARQGLAETVAFLRPFAGLI